VAESGLEVARSNRGSIAATRGFRDVTAPFDGIVTARNVDPGTLISSGSNTSNTMLFSIAKTDVLRIYVYVPEQYISEVRVGEKAAITVEAYPKDEFVGTVAYVAGGVDPTSRTLQVEIHVPNQNHRLLPGMYAQVHFRAPSTQRLPIIPGSALQVVADGNFVYTIDSQNRAHLNKVQISRDMGADEEILSGISVGDRVIVSPPDDLVDGAVVNPVLLHAPEKKN
jgi:RND family efflux transporter MFP subunit